MPDQNIASQSFRLRFRQVHLDFHTSAACEQVGAQFDADQFAATVKAGHVDSMTVFAKCHHGFSYYPTKVGTMHPHLSFDLMGQQIEALHRVDVRAPIYITVMWDELAGEKHPEWIVMDREGKLKTRPPTWGAKPSLGGEGWTTLDVSSGYADYIVAQVEEISQAYPVDGFFFDILFSVPNYSPWGLSQMRAAGVSPLDLRAVQQFTDDQLLRFFERVSGVVRSQVPKASIFYNGSVLPNMKASLAFQTHIEIESLPTSGFWGYLHYPISVHHARTYGVDYLGQTGRFHRSWADFGGLKTRNQLEYECGVILAAGGKISVGDQLHPSGVLDPAVYRLLGDVFGRVEQLEPWLQTARPTAEVAILSVLNRASGESFGEKAYSLGVEGAAQMLLESAIQFDIVPDDDLTQDWRGYRVIILPDDTFLSEAVRAKVQAYLAQGGKLLISGKAGLDTESGAFVIDPMPVRYIAPCPTMPAYLRLDDSLIGESEMAADYDYVLYGSAEQVAPVEGAAHSGQLRRALFNRNWEHFTSHAHAPVGDYLDSPIVASNAQITYIAAALFTGYRQHDYWVYRALAISLLRQMLPVPLLETNAPGWIETTLHTDMTENVPRKLVHLVAYHPRRTMQAIPHVDQSALTAGIVVSVRRDGMPINDVYTAPERQKLAFSVETRADVEYVRVELPPLGVYTVLVIE